MYTNIRACQRLEHCQGSTRAVLHPSTTTPLQHGWNTISEVRIIELQMGPVFIGGVGGRHITKTPEWLLAGQGIRAGCVVGALNSTIAHPWKTTIGFWCCQARSRFCRQLSNWDFFGCHIFDGLRERLWSTVWTSSPRGDVQVGRVMGWNPSSACSAG